MTTVVFTNNISLVKLYPSLHCWFEYKIAENYKLKVGRTWWGLPIYEIIPKAVTTSAGLFAQEYVCPANEFKHARYMVKGDEMYYKPHCELWLNNGKYKSVFFDTVAELEAYIADLVSKAPHVIINE
jgi:hypothetical protein